jgi:hypothetical protein
MSMGHMSVPSKKSGEKKLSTVRVAREMWTKIWDKILAL